MRAEWMETLLQISLSTAAVIGVLLLLVPLWQRRYSARWRKVIWLVLAVRLLVPVSLELPRQPVQLDMDLQAATVWQSGQLAADGQNMPEPVAQVIAGQTAARQQTLTGEHDISQATGQRTISRGVILAAIWLLGVVSFLLWHGLQYGLFRRKALRMAQPLEDGDGPLERAAEGLQLRYLPEVAVSGAIQGPMLLGFGRPVILLPSKIYGERELSLILRHELTHHKLYDLWYKLVLLLANAVHWFNPLVWLMVRQAGRDVEQVCDEQVVQGQDLAYRKAYSMTILHAMADQRGIALSTSLSKQAQNGKKRFAAILYPRQTKKGVAALLTVILLAVAASGCLQVGKMDDAVAVYKQVARFLPEQAIQEPTVYEIRDDEAMDMTMYLWIEEPDQPLEDGTDGYAIGWTDDDGNQYLPQRALAITVSKADRRVVGYQYQRNEASLTPEQPSPLAQSAQRRKAYVQKAARKLLAGGAGLDFTEVRTEQDEQGQLRKSYFACGTMADAQWYSATLNCQYGYLESLFCWNEEQLAEADMVHKEATVYLEGEAESMKLGLNRRPGYYVLFTEATAAHSQAGRDGAFCDRYVLQAQALDGVQAYLQVGLVPDCTVDQWLAAAKTGSTYGPQTGGEPLAWRATGELKDFPEDRVRQWQTFTADGAKVINRCYVTPYREGCMVAQLSCPVEYEEGWGSRMRVMLDTLVLATESMVPEEPQPEEGAEAYQLAAPYLPADLDLTGMEYVQEPLEMGYQRSLWRYRDGDTESDDWLALYFNQAGQVVEMGNSINQQLLRGHEWQLTEAEAKQLAEACLADWGGETVALLPWGSNGAAFYTTDLAEQEYGWTAASGEAGYFYDIVINGQYGYVKHYRKYYANPQLRQQVLDWLAAEQTALYGNQYTVLGFSADAVQEYRQGQTYTITLLHTMRYQNQGAPEDDASLQWIAVNKPEEYEAMYAAYQQPQESSLPLKIVATVQENGWLELETCAIYGQDFDAQGRALWTQIPDLSVYVGNGQTGMPGWSADAE